MPTNHLEEFVKTNREEFDFREPTQEVWDKIAIDIKKPKTISLRNYFMRAAAVIAVVAISSILVWKSDLLPQKGLANNTDNPEIIELIEAEAFYSNQVDKKLEEIQKCYNTYPELEDEIETDLTELENMYKVLKTDLQDNISNTSVIEAMIENNRFRLKICDDVLQQINC